jgi:ABC-type sugar transport system ATPase subunit
VGCRRTPAGDRGIKELAPKNRDIAMVFRNYALYPYLTFAANIADEAHLFRPVTGERIST